MRESRNRRNLVVMGEGGESTELSRYDGTEMGDVRVGG